MNIECAPQGQTLTRAIPALTPAQAQVYAKLEKVFRAVPLVALAGDRGTGKTTVLEVFQARHGGHLIRRDEILRVVSTVPPGRADAAVKAHFERLLAQHDLILFDNYTDLIENSSLHWPTLGHRLFYFTRFLVPLMHSAVVRQGKRLVMAGRSLVPPGGSVPEPLAELYGSPKVALLEMPEFGKDDYAVLAANVLGTEKASDIDFKRVYDYASHLNCYELDVAASLVADIEAPTTAQFIDGLRNYVVRANTKTKEVEALTFDTLPGAEEIVAKLETHVVLPLENQDLANQLDLRPKRGVLLYGPPGTGKTSIGRALAHRMKGKFFLIDGSIVTDWPGWFFHRVKMIFNEAKAAAPSVVFIDDADVLFTIPQIAGLPRFLLSLLDGLESGTAGKVCVMMTAMDASKIPQALLRSGRVELWLEARLPAEPVRARILERWMAHELPQSDAVDYTMLAKLTEGCTPADLRRLIADAKNLFAADHVQKRTPESATDYLRRAVENIMLSRQQMNVRLNEPVVPPETAAAQVEAVSAAEFDQVVLGSEVPVLVDFWASWCGPCKAIAPILEELAPVYADRLKIVKLNCEENPELANSYQIRSIPCLMMFKGGEIVANQSGAIGRAEIKALIESALPEDRIASPLKAKYGMGVGGMAETGVGCKMSGW